MRWLTPALPLQAPLAGTLMEVLQAVRFADGRLLVLAVGVGRFRVAKVGGDWARCKGGCPSGRAG